MTDRARRKQRRQSEAKGAVELLEEAQHLVRMAPLSALTAYFIGTVPFILALLYFWADMSRSAFAVERCLPASLGLAVLFLWMKCWQTVYAAGLRDHLAGVPPEPWTRRRIARAAATQAAVQPLGLLTIPMALFFLMPFYAVYGYYQNITALGDGRDEGHAVRDARRMAVLWPRQNHLLLWIVSPWILGVGMLLAFGCTAMMFSLNPEIVVDNSFGWMLFGFFLMYLFVFPCSPFGTLIAANVGIIILVAPYLLAGLSGVETAPTMSGPFALLNTTFVSTVWGLSYLILDPLAKAAYVLRCFYGTSRTTGQDLRARLRSLARPAGRTVALLLILFAAPETGALEDGAFESVAAPPLGALEHRAEDGRGYRRTHGISSEPIDPAALSESVDVVLAQPEYAWRMERERPDVLRENKTMLVVFLESVGDMIERGFRKFDRLMRRIREWFEELFRRKDRPTDNDGGGNWVTPIRLLWIGALVALVGVALYFAYRVWRQRAPRREEIEAEPATVTAAVLEDAVVASALPSEEWMRLARECIARGEWRLAVHAMFLASLADLGAFEWLTIASYKSNGQYLRELRRGAVRHPELLRAFVENMSAFERTWYGDHEVTQALLDEVEQNREIIARDAVPA